MTTFFGPTPNQSLHHQKLQKRGGCFSFWMLPLVDNNHLTTLMWRCILLQGTSSKDYCKRLLTEVISYLIKNLTLSFSITSPQILIPSFKRWKLWKISFKGNKPRPISSTCVFCWLARMRWKGCCRFVIRCIMAGKLDRDKGGHVQFYGRSLSCDISLHHLLRCCLALPDLLP